VSSAAATTGAGGQALAPPPPHTDTFIPTPDAQGIVANYEDMYPKCKIKALSIQRFSDSPEESIRWGLQPKSYTMDERDASWLEQHNQHARGEGTSTSGGGSAQTSPRRSSKKGKEPEDFSPIAMTEDEFELVMGLFEKYTSDHLPYLHLVRVSLPTKHFGTDTPRSQDATLSSIPSFSFFEAFMASPLPPSIFATFVVPPDIPEPDKLFRLGQSIHPHWHLRRVDRKGRPIIPDINLDEAEDGSVYVCFRRREVKAVRKTRRMEITSVEKLTRLNIEFEIALELVDKIVEREEVKREICAHDAHIWGHRNCMIAVTNKFPNLRSPEDDKYLIDKEKIKRKPLGVDTTNILRIPRGGLPSAGALFSAGGLRTSLLHEEEQDLGQAIVHPRERYEQIQKLIEGDLHTKNEAMYGMEDHTDVRRLYLSTMEYLLTFCFGQ
jgi:enhancer of polycomb-like protein